MLNSAKKLALKNKDKIATGVDKATEAIDKKTHGKYHDKLEKVDGAASKFAGKPKDAAAAATTAPATDGVAERVGAEATEQAEHATDHVESARPPAETPPAV